MMAARITAPIITGLHEKFFNGFILSASEKPQSGLNCHFFRGLQMNRDDSNKLTFSAGAYGIFKRLNAIFFWFWGWICSLWPPVAVALPLPKV